VEPDQEQSHNQQIGVHQKGALSANSWTGRRTVLILVNGGGIAAYKSPDLNRTAGV